ncbi:Solute carrier organic anion transporter family member 4A1 [Thelohanellus kitauei]|uniref:Solute carrier organic anion transporter family member 4A1 n=1 Tax=Thelohanellus kitauei TaxID=669202 RepID=A0A0C2MMN1_THEKT|nr:Solute carrier organic anion transporter family member 4A1 [Thelohanellus kitauei]
MVVKTEDGQKLQNLARKGDYVQLVILYLVSIVQGGLVTGGISVSISSIEKAFHLSNFYVVLIFTFYNIFVGIVSIPLTYIAKNHKQIYISIGMFLICIGGIIFIMPVLMKSNQELNVTINSHLCIENKVHIQETEDPSQALYLSLMYVSFALIGIGAAPIFTIAIKYIFETFPEEKTPVFTSIFNMCQMFGSMIVFIFSKFILKIHIFPWQQHDQKITPEQETWVGAYWLTYLIGSMVMFVLMILNLIVTRFNARSRSK